MFLGGFPQPSYIASCRLLDQFPSSEIAVTKGGLVGPGYDILVLITASKDQTMQSAANPIKIDQIIRKLQMFDL